MKLLKIEIIGCPFGDVDIGSYVCRMAGGKEHHFVWS